MGSVLRDGEDNHPALLDLMQIRSRGLCLWLQRSRKNSEQTLLNVNIVIYSSGHILVKVTLQKHIKEGE